MPFGEYFGGKGRRVADQMKKRYGKDWERVFYATANKMGLKPKSKYSRAEKILSGSK